MSALQGVAVSAPAFLGPGDFGNPVRPRAGLVAEGLQSTYEGTLAITMLETPLVQAVLPATLKLAQPTTGPAPRHPVIYMIGTQGSPSQVRGGTATPIATAGAYKEMILLVPFVTHVSGTYLHSYAVRMYLDDLSAVVGGNLVFGYAKEWARIDATGPADKVAHAVRSLLGQTYFVDEVTVPSLAAGVQQAQVAPPPRWGDIAKILDMPIVGVAPSGFVCSYWEWDTSAASLLGATTTHQYVEPFVTGMQAWTGLGTLASAPDGAVSIKDMRWRLEWQLPPWQPPSCVF